MAFIGAGKMAEAILGGLPPVNWDNTVACDFSEARVRVFRERFGISVLADGAETVRDADVVSVIEDGASSVRVDRNQGAKYCLLVVLVVQMMILLNHNYLV